MFATGTTRTSPARAGGAFRNVHCIWNCLEWFTNLKSAKKRVRLIRDANVRNRATRSRLRTAVKRVENAKDAKTAEVEYRKVQELLDRAATARLLHPNTVARMKSNLARSVAAMS